MHLFWERGYAAASLDDLLQATDLSKSSFYETFGNKRDLLLVALAHYREVMVDQLAAPLRQPGAGPAEIRETLRRIAAHALTADGARGCFANNCLVEVAPHDEEVAGAARAVRDSLEQAFMQAVASGQASGLIASRERPRALARFLVNTVTGLNVAAKSRPGRAVLDDIVRVALRVLD